jgi:hypothetical protein
VSEVWKDPIHLVKSDVQQRLVQKVEGIKIPHKILGKRFKKKTGRKASLFRGTLERLISGSDTGG